MLMQKPVVAARTFQLTDYASENEVLFYHPGDARHLREQIQRIMQNEAFRNRLVQNAFTRVVNEFTEENYLIRLLETCRDIMGKKASMKS
jgi:glycosyltransferase involved in cell wall biosynthesis